LVELNFRYNSSRLNPDQTVDVRKTRRGDVSDSWRNGGGPNMLWLLLTPSSMNNGNNGLVGAMNSYAGEAS
jgi:hypothetical protein